MNWYRFAEDIGHGDTLHGQMMKKEILRLVKDIAGFRAQAASGGPDSVMPRFRGEIRQRLLRLPAIERVERMSMFELDLVSAEIADIKAQMNRYSIKRFNEIMGC